MEAVIDPDAICAICGETWLDENGLQHADISSGHVFTEAK